MRGIVRNVFEATTMTVLLLAVTAASADAKALKCKLDGTFFPPTFEVLTADVLTSALGSCSGLGKSAHAGVLTTGTTPDVNGCVSVSSTEPMVAFNKKGDSISYTVTGTQCFEDASGATPTTAGFCGPSTDTYSSTLNATITITGGTGKKAGASGTGALSGVVDHCDASAPFGNSFHAAILGSVTP